ncbi:hypothetical protein BD779DRAFT_931443 [Infundibulicybe gibba]|nr:hypothetical protein BD779DRAFT_931443 [Infundibulicybe gibba]
MQSFKEAWGGVTVCFLLAAVLNGIIVMQVCAYFSKFKEDSPPLRYAIAFIWLGTVLHFACECWVMHSVLVTGFFKLPLDVTIPLVFPISGMIQALTHCCAQGVYIYRMHRFGHRVWILVLCCALLVLGLGLALSFSGRTAHTVSAAQLFVWCLEDSWKITSIFIINAVLDLCTTISMCVQLWYDGKGGLNRTRYIVDKIIQWTVQTAMVTSTVAIAIVIVWNVQHSTLWVGLSGVELDCYVCCLLTLLNARTQLRASDRDLFPSIVIPSTTMAAGESGRLSSAVMNITGTPPEGVLVAYPMRTSGGI